jgi:hypothetical protein
MSAKRLSADTDEFVDQRHGDDPASPRVRFFGIKTAEELRPALEDILKGDCGRTIENDYASCDQVNCRSIDVG